MENGGILMNIIKGRIKERAVKAVLYGPEGIGKTTFASKWPTPLFFDTERGSLDISVARMDLPTSWTMLLEQIKYIKANPNPWQTLVIDTADWAETFCIQHICDTKKVSGIEDFGYGKGYVYVEEEFGRMLNLLTDIWAQSDMNIFLIAHAQMRKFEQPDELGAYDRWELKLEKKIAALVKEWADMILFVNYKTYVVNVDNQGAAKGKNKAQGGKRVMYTQHHNCWDAKNRFGLAEELPFEFSEISHVVHGRSIPDTTAPTKTLAEELKEPCALDAPAKRIEPLPPEPDPPITAAEQLIMDNAPEPTDGIPKALADLMTMNGVTVQEIQWAVSHCGNGGKGYYPESTPISNYDPQFVAGVLVSAWAQVFGAIKANRNN
jgi:hypothetical protein